MSSYLLLLNQSDFQSGKVDQAVEWVRAAGQRNVRAALPTLIRAASAESRPLRRRPRALAITRHGGPCPDDRFTPHQARFSVIKMLAAVGRKEGPRKERQNQYWLF